MPGVVSMRGIRVGVGVMIMTIAMVASAGSLADGAVLPASGGGVPGRQMAPATRLALAFSARGVVVDGDVLHLGLSALGRAGALRPLPATRPQRGPAAVDYARPGISEWYVKSAAGLQQGFTLTARPAGQGPLMLVAGEVGAGDVVKAASDGQSLALVSATRRSFVTYGGLRVTDALGRRLAARIAVVRGRIVLRIDDAGARYPLRVDPFIEQQEYFAPDAGKNDDFGDAVAIDGNTMVVGAPGDEDGTFYGYGAAFVYTQTSPGVWSEDQTLTGSDSDDRGDAFGSAVAVSGSTIVVGAPGATADGVAASGAAYVFTESGGVWSEAQELFASDAESLALYGSALTMSGQTIVVGAWQQSIGGNLNDVWGAVYVYTPSGPGSTWTQVTEIDGPTTNNDENGFGYSLAVSGLTLYIGDDDLTVDSQPETGAVWAYTEASSSDNWGSDTTVTELTPPSNGSDLFGFALAAQGSTLLVGAPDADGAAGAGLVYTVPADGNLGNATLDATLQPSANKETEYGSAVALDGDTIILGSDAEAEGYEDTAGTWTDEGALSENDGGVAVSGATAVVGYPLAYDTGVSGTPQTGAFYSFLYTAGTSYELSVSLAGTGSGTVTSADGEIDCGTTCSASYPSGTQVTLTATPAAGSTFTGWSGAGCSGTGTCVVTMDAAQGVTATFTASAPPSYTLSVSKAGSGSGTVTSADGGIDCGTTCSASYPSGTHVTLTAAAVAGSTFSGWSGAGCSGTGTCVVTLTAAENVTASFATASPAPTPPPVNVTPPVITGSPQPGRTLRCSTGTWTGDPSSYAYQWELTGRPVAGATSSSFVVQIADEASGPSDTLVCVVTARNPEGSASAPSQGVLVASGSTKCPRPTGSLSGLKIGVLRIGMTKTQARKTLKIFKVTKNRFDNFCLFAGWGIRVAYPTPSLLKTVSPHVARGLKNRIAIALTANPFYAFKGVRPGTAVASVIRRLHLGKPFHVGSNEWYFSPAKPANGLLKVRGGIIQEVGLATRALSGSRHAQSRLLRAFPDD